MAMAARGEMASRRSEEAEAAAPICQRGVAGGSTSRMILGRKKRRMSARARDPLL
jgi:hypothetical protein